MRVFPQCLRTELPAPDQLRRIVGEAAGMLLLVALASVSLFYGACVIWMLVAGGEFDWLVLAVAAMAMITRHTLDFASNAFRGLERFEFENLSRVLQTALFALFVWAGVYPQTGGVLAGFVAFMASNVVAAALIVTILVWRWNCREFHLSRGTMRDWLRESLPLGVGDSVRRLIMQLDTLLLAAFRPPALVGLFSVAYRPLQPLQLLPRTIVSVTFPMMSRVAHSDRAALSRAFARTTNILWVASLPIALLTTACAAPLILATAGPDFSGAIWPLRILIWVAPLVFINAQLRFAFTATRGAAALLEADLLDSSDQACRRANSDSVVWHVWRMRGACAWRASAMRRWTCGAARFGRQRTSLVAAIASCPCGRCHGRRADTCLGAGRVAFDDRSLCHAFLASLRRALPTDRGLALVGCKTGMASCCPPRTAQRMNNRERQSPAPSERIAEGNVDRSEISLHASAVESRLRGAELAKTR